MKLTDISVNKPVFTSVIVIIAVVIGIYSYTLLGVELLPPTDFPVVSITTLYPGASPEDIKESITKKIEETVSTIDGIKHIKSTSLEGISFVTVEFNLSKNINQAAIDISNKISRIKRALPEDADDPIIQKFDVNARPFMRIAVTGDFPLSFIRRITEDDIKKQLLQMDGMASIKVVGGEEREIQVLVDPDRMLFYKVPFMQIVSAIQHNNINIPIGHIESKEVEYSIRVKGEVSDYCALNNINVQNINGAILPLHTLAKVKSGIKERNSFARLNTKSSIILNLYKRTDANIVTLANSVRDRLKQIERILPTGLKVDVVHDRSEFIKNAVSNVIKNMIIGIVLTSLVLWLFLNRIYPTLIIALAMPTSVISTFLLFSIANFTLNIMSLMGLAISVGVLVNNSILVLENIYRYHDLGYSYKEAARKGSAEIFLAVFSTTLTNIAVFVPIAFMGGTVGMLFKQFGLVVVFSTLMSLLVSFTLTPMMAAHPLGRARSIPLVGLLPKVWNAIYNFILSIYIKILKKLLHYPKTSLTGFIFIFLASFTLFPMIGFQFYPRVDRGTFSIQIELPPSSTLNDTKSVVLKVEKLVRKIPEVKYITSSAGGSGSSSGVNYGEVSVKLVNKKDRKRSTFAVAYSLRKDLAGIPGAKFIISILSGRHSNKPIQIEIRGKSVSTLNRIANQIEERLKEIKGTADIDTDWRMGKPQLKLKPYIEKLPYYHTTTTEISTTLRYYISGKSASTYREKGEDYDITVKVDPKRIKDIRDIENLPLIDKNYLIPVKEVVSPTYTIGPVAIKRVDQLNTVTVSCNVVNRSTGKMYQDISKKLKGLKLPSGYTIRFGGEVATMKEEFATLFKALILAIVLTFLLIAAILESYRYAVIIMLTVPFAVVGILIALLLTRVTLNIFGIMGIIMLVGLVVNNAIVILDYAFILRKEGKNPYDAITTSCRVRLRPILMANLTTIAGWIPLVLGFGEGGEYMRAMAVVVTGGLISGGWLALFVIPIIYYIRERKRKIEADSTSI